MIKDLRNMQQEYAKIAARFEKIAN